MMNSFFSELKRRNVVRVAIAYAVVAWVILQFVDIVEDPLSLPDWFQKVVIVLVAIGFPIALVISWAFEVTPEGVKKTAEVDKSKSVTHGTGQKINKLIIGGLVLAVVFLLADRFYLEDNRPDTGISEAQAGQTSIAVLPFVNMSSDPEQEFFSDGITEEILNVLAKNRSLKVAGRTSSFAYKGKDQDLRAIGKDLGVEYLIEGSIRKSGDTLRITAQLVQAKDGFHIWSETYDRQLTDIFAVQDEIARAISDALEVSFGTAEGGSLVANTTDNMAAYDLYLKARDAHKNRHVKEALELSEKVTEIEPDFAPGWAVYAQALALAPDWLYNNDPMESEASLAKAYVAAQKALILDPNSVEALGALANVYRTRLQWRESEKAYLKALSIDPDNPVILEDYNEFLLAVGKVKASLPVAKKLAKLEPQVPIYLHALVQSYLANEDYAAALPYAKKEFELGPELFFMASEYSAVLWFNGKRKEARDLIEGTVALSPDYREGLIALLDLREKGPEGITPDQVRFAMSDPNFFVLLNQKENFFSFLSKQIQLGYWGDFFSFFPDMKPYFKTSEFKNYVEELKLVDYWRTNGWGDYCKPVGNNDFECK